VPSVPLCNWGCLVPDPILLPNLHQHLVAWRGGALGDFVATFPALQELRAQHPGVPLHLITRPAYGPLAVRLGLADSWSSLFAAEYLPLESGLGDQFLENCTALRAWLPSRDTPLAGCLARHGQVWPSVVDSTAHLPAWRQLGGTREPVASALGGENIVLHPGSGSSVKNLPLAAWERLLAAISPEIPVVIVTGEPEEENGIADWAAVSGKEHRRCPRLIDLAAELLRARAFLGNDSGVGHLAGWLGIPSSIYFGPTNAAVWKPYGSRVAALVAPQRRMDDPELLEIALADLRFQKLGK
jgi:heptosyltransferase III